MWKVFQMNRANVYSLLHFSLPLNVTCKGFWWAFRQRVDRKLKILLELLTKMLDANDWSSAAPKCICLISYFGSRNIFQTVYLNLNYLLTIPNSFLLLTDFPFLLAPLITAFYFTFSQWYSRFLYFIITQVLQHDLENMNIHPY